SCDVPALLALLTAGPPSMDLRAAVLDVFGASAAAPAPSASPGLAPTEAEPAYGGSYATPVLGTDTQRRVVGPPPLAGGLHGSGAAPSARAAPTPGSAAAPPQGAHGSAPAPAFL